MNFTGMSIGRKLILLFTSLFMLAIFVLGYLHLNDAVEAFEHQKASTALAALDAGHNVRVSMGKAWKDELISSDAFTQAKECRKAASTEARLQCARQTNLHPTIPVIRMLDAVKAAMEHSHMGVRVFKRDRPRDPKAQGSASELALLDELSRSGKKDLARADAASGQFVFVREIRADEGCLECHGNKQKSIGLVLIRRTGRSINRLGQLFFPRLYPSCRKPRMIFC